MAEPVWWKFPFKPVRISTEAAKRMDLSKYVLEKKYDGWRAMVMTDKSGRPSLWTRQKRLLVTPENLLEEIRSLNIPPETVMDAEIWNPQQRGGWEQNTRVECMLGIWDVLVTSGKDVGSSTLEGRQEELRTLIGEGSQSVRVVKQYEASGNAIDEVMTEAETFRKGGARSGFVHGVVLKRKGSPRRDHCKRSVEHSDWLKVVFS